MPSKIKDQITGKGLVFVTRLLLIYIQLMMIIVSCGFLYYSSMEWRATQEAKASAAKVRIMNSAKLDNIQGGKIIKPQVIYVPTQN